MTWRYSRIGPNATIAGSEWFYAPCLDNAFVQARQRFATLKFLTLFETQMTNPNRQELSI